MNTRFRLGGPAFAALLLALCAGTTLQAGSLEEQLENAPPIVRVEEDWEVVIGDPDPEADLPQVVTVFGPTNAFFGTHTVFELNHGTLPSFVAGGMQIQVWWGESLVGYKQQNQPVQLAIAGEIVRYTTVTELSNHVLKMRVVNGTSETWGGFGGGSLMLVELISLRSDLNPYDPYNSINHSRVTFGANRVNRFLRREIRFYSAEGLYLQDQTPTYVHKLAADVEPEAAQ